MSFLSQIPTEGVVIGTGVAAMLAGGWFFNFRKRQKSAAVQEQAESILAQAKREAESLLREAKLNASEERAQMREEAEKSFAIKRDELFQMEKRLTEREAVINHQAERLVKEEEQLRQRSDEWKQKLEELHLQKTESESLLHKQRLELEKIAGITSESARKRLLDEVEKETAHEASRLNHRIIEEAKSRAEDKARQIISVAIQRYAGEHTFESSTSMVALSGDEIKGRIIGREGRNIRAFEAATGVTVLIDDTPNAVVLSGFDPVRREVAREAMSRLIADGRIHPTRIEEVVAKVTSEMEDTILESGENAIMRAGLPPMHPEIVKLLGRLKFRHSFAQNILDHSVEVAHLTGLMAAELGVDVQLAKRAGLLHDIGKAVNHEMEGSHALIGADLVKRHGEHAWVVNGVAAHHDEVAHECPLGLLVSAADAISASRPGARSETMTTYIKRVENLEKIALSYNGVDKAYAVQAGRELRVFVKPEKVNDEEAFQLSRQIARQVENELQYPGQIRVIVVRETRSSEVAK